MLSAALPSAKPVIESWSRRWPMAPMRFCSASRPPVNFRPVHSVGRMIESKGDVSSAGYLKWREILPTEPPRRPIPTAPQSADAIREVEVRLRRIAMHQLRDVLTPAAAGLREMP